MRHRFVFGALALGLVLLLGATAADALPGLGGLSVNRNPVSVNRTADAVDRAVPGGGPTQDDRAAQRRARTRQRRAALVAHWQGVADCESGGNWSTNTGNGYYGGLQFSLQTWQAYGGRGMPNEQPAWYQSGIAERVRHDVGLSAWPNCGRYYVS
jgi:hypothetical protein